MQLEFDAELWIWAARQDESWTFVSLPPDASEDIRHLTGGSTRRGFGAVRVEVRIGTTVWRTSIFPDAGREAYVLPIKKAVRKAQKLDAGDTVRVALELVR
ncbi:DUF1905 domain-containing protein [Paractinoplanes ferrugineus]|uniref:DUF1905 domain-containing protein n=1 Tax=Paractinoplanes ferrugineus TaxID=113564 RepID=A0A919J776_9ACTN|nr:DUF1905 domain-containing protein [Actinoplanes ferrugineus]GIE16121.1 hypothetical protein Afe05nite_79610 [Actinoplanes ferrugineus]